MTANWVRGEVRGGEVRGKSDGKDYGRTTQTYLRPRAVADEALVRNDQGVIGVLRPVPVLVFRPTSQFTALGG